MKETKFKQTEVGMIPCDWELYELGQLYNITSSKRVFQKDWTTAGIPFYRAREIAVMSTGKTPEEDLFITKEMFESYTKQYGRIKENDVLITGVGTLGKVYVVKQHDEFYFKDGNIIWLQWKGKNSSSLLKQFYETEIVINQIFGNSGGSTVATYTIANAKKTKLPLPPTIEEQKRIAQALSDVDAVISTTEKIIAKKKALKQGAMQTLLSGKMRIQNGKWIKTTHFKQTELGPIPQEWEMKSFGELFEILPNNTLSRAELNEGQGSYKNVHYGDVLVKFQEWIDCSKTALPFINSDAKFNHTSLQDGDVIIADTAEDETVGKSTEIFNAHNLKIVSGLHTIPIRPKTKFASKWLGYFINSACWHNQILPFITGTKVSAISKAAVAQTKFFYPAKMDEQTAIATVLSDMDSEIAALETKLAKYRQLKTGMMQQLLTGKIRLV